MKNRRAADQSLRHLQERRTQKSLKKEIDQRRKGLETLKERILHYEAQLR